MQNHTCLKIVPRATDYVKGVNSPIAFKAMNGSGNWTSRLEFFTLQEINGFETNGCVLWTASEDFDAQMDYLIENGSVPEAMLAEIRTMGFMDLGNDGLPHFHSSPRFLQGRTGNGFNGNSLPDAWDAVRKYGVLPWTDLPFDSSVTEAEYLTPPSEVMLAKAAQFLALIGGKNAVQYHWVINDAQKNLTEMAVALEQAPLQLGIALLDSGWNQVEPTDPPTGELPQHSVMNYAMDGSACQVLDHYVPFEKLLDVNYPVNYVLQGIVSIIAAEEAHIVSEVATVIPEIAEQPPAEQNPLLETVEEIVKDIEEIL